MLLDKTILEKIDSTGMYEVYDRWPEIAREAFQSNLNPVDFKNIKHIVFSGMGGSGAVGDLFLSILSKTPIHVTIVKGYLLPKTVNAETLVVATSVSGNTVETLSTVEAAKKLGCKIICFSSGGKLEEVCKSNNIEYRKIPLYKNPRTSFPAYVYSILKVLNSILPISKESIDESISELDVLSKSINSNNLNESNPSLKLAKWMSDISVIYYPWGLQAAAIRFKNSIQENSKNHAMIEDIIEACHNGIVAWEKNSKVKPILIRGTEDYIKTKERWQVIKEFFEENKIEFWEVTSIEGNVLSKIITLVYLLDFTAIYKAVLDDIDPFPIKSIDFVKERL